MAKLIEFEGIDGSGKTTAYKYVAAQLEAKGLRVLTTREVGSPHIPVCTKLREVILDPNTKMDGKAMEFVFAAMRVENTIFYQKVDNDYDIILNDRGWFSHLAYTDHNVDQYFTSLLYLQNLIEFTRLPDEVVFLDIDPELAAGRRVSRGEQEDAIEIKGNEFQKRVYDSFLKYLGIWADLAPRLTPGEPPHVTIHSIDASQDLKGVQQQLDQVVDRIVNERLSKAK